jgi:hypothetical protein
MSATSPFWRLVFLLLGLVYLVAAVGLFVFAESIATLPVAVRGDNPWPWAIGPLALRFIAALAFTATATALLTAWRPDGPTVRAAFVLTLVISVLFVVHLLLHVGDLNWAKPLAWVWAGVVSLALLSSAVALLGTPKTLPDPAVQLPPTPRFAQGVNAFIFFLTGLVGGTMLLLPQVGLERWPWDLSNAVNVQLLGAIFVTVAISAGWVWLRPSWYGYDLQYASAGVFAVVALVASFMHWTLFAAHPVGSIFFVITYVLGAFLGFYPFFRYVFRPENRLITHRPGGTTVAQPTG